MRLRCEVAIPGGLRQGRLPIKLGQPDPDVVEILPVGDFGNATHQIIDACGLPLITHLPDADTMVSGDIQKAGYWEFAESMALLSLVQPGMTVVDAGANIGYYSALLSQALQPSGQVYAFEPEPRNHLVSTANVLLTRKLSPQAAPAEVFLTALTDQIGNARLNLYGGNLGMHSLVYGNGGAAGSSVVPTTTLDALRWGSASATGLPRRIDVIKADVQGSELALLRGAERTIERDRPVLCLECEPYLTGAAACSALVEWLQDHRYPWFRVFHSNVRDPYQALAEWARLLSAAEVLEQIRHNQIGPYGSLMAYPGPRERLGAAGAGA
jgi:FkbM family methyltransferase